MVDLSHWFAQACEYHDSEGTFKVIYIQDRHELITVVEELLRNGDSWSDDLFSSNTMPSPDDTGYWEPTKSYSSDPASKPVQVLAGNKDLDRFISKKLFDDLPGSSISRAVPENDIPKALYYEGGKEALQPSQTIATNSSKNDDLFQEAKEKEKMKYKKSMEQGILSRVTKLFKKPRQMHPLRTYKTQDPYQNEGGSSLPIELINYLKDLNDNLYKSAKPPGFCKYALLFGITTEFNPSGVWVIEELYNDMQEADI